MNYFLNLLGTAFPFQDFKTLLVSLLTNFNSCFAIVKKSYLFFAFVKLLLAEVNLLVKSKITSLPLLKSFNLIEYLFTIIRFMNLNIYKLNEKSEVQ